jgi:hypothetical protein
MKMISDLQTMKEKLKWCSVSHTRVSTNSERIFENIASQIFFRNFKQVK